MARAEESRGGHADWIQDALTGIGVAIITTDAEARILSLNSVAESLTG